MLLPFIVVVNLPLENFFSMIFSLLLTLLWSSGGFKKFKGRVTIAKNGHNNLQKYFCRICANIKSNNLRWWLHDPVLLGRYFNASSRDRFHPTIAWGNRFSSRQGGTGFRVIPTFVYFFLIDWRHLRCKNIIEVTIIYWNVLLWIFSNWCVNLLFYPA